MNPQVIASFRLRYTMNNVFKVENIVMKPLVRVILKNPKIMKSKVFLKIMSVFPGKISRNYDRKISKMGHDYEAAFIEGLNQISNEPKKVLDICTGTGFAALLLAEHYKEATIEAVDLSPEMIKISKEKMELEGYTNLRFSIGNAMDLDFNDNEFDVVVSTNAPVYLEEATRVLKPGGELLVAFSFGGKIFDKAKQDIIVLIHKHGLELKMMKSSEQGVFILAKGIK